MSKEALFKMDFNCGRMGNLESVFISTKEKVQYLKDYKLRFILAKCSENISLKLSHLNS